MQNNKYNKKTLFLSVILACAFAYMPCAWSDEYQDDDNIAIDAIANYDVSGSLFQQITGLEQDKILMKLEKERAQLDLELDRLAAEKIKLQMEIDTLSGRAEQQQQEFEMEKARLENETAKLEIEKQNLMSGELVNPVRSANAPVPGNVRNNNPVSEPGEFNIIDKYKLQNVIGAGSQLQATLVDKDTGQNKRVSVGRVLDGFTVKSISLDEGVVFIKDGKTQTLNVANAK